MSSTIEIKETYVRSSDRVNSIDVHPTEPWVLLSVYPADVCIWNHKSKVTEKTFDMFKSQVQCVKFITRKEWIAIGDIDGFIRVYNYNTMEIVTEFQAHSDYLRSLAVHPSKSYLLSSSDDTYIKLWDWENGWECIKTFKGHHHFVMQVSFNPRDANVFASASMDCTLKFWDLGSSDSLSSIQAHEQNLNCVEFFETDGKLYVLTGSGDQTAKVWDYESMTCIKTLEGHEHNVNSLQCVKLNPSFIMTGCGDWTARVWNTKTYNLEHSFIAKLGQVWTIGFVEDTSEVFFGCDTGMIVGEVTSTSC